MKAYLRLCAVFVSLMLLAGILSACADVGDPVTYGEIDHTHVYGHWYDVAPEEDGEPVTRQARYCKICHDEDIREKE